MTRISNSFEGGTDGVTVSTGNSGGASGTAFTQVPAAGGGSVVYDDDGLLLIDTMAVLCTGASGGTGYVTWDETAWQTETEVWTRFYFRKSGNPTSNFTLHSLAAASTTVWECQLTTAGELRMRDATATARYTSAALDNAAHRVEAHIVHSATVGHMELRIFSGANLHGTVPDQTIGSAVTNWNLGASSNRVRYGVATNPGGAIQIWLDEVAIDDVAWIGSADDPPAEPTQLDTPIFTAERTPGAREAVFEWGDVENEDSYLIEVEILDEGGNPDDPTDWSALDTFPAAADAETLTIDDSDGLDWGRTYRARITAVAPT